MSEHPVTTIPPAPNALPVLGNALSLLRDPLRFLTSLPAHGDLVGVRFGRTRVIVVCDPELTRQVFLRDRTFDKGGPLIDASKQFLGDGLFSCPHSQHRRQRRLLQPSFHPDRLPGYAEVMTRRIATVTGSWHDGQTIDVTHEMLTITSHILVTTMFSSSLPPRVSREVIELATVLIRGVFRRGVTQRLNWLPWPGNRRYDQAVSRFRLMLDAIVAERRGDDTDRGDMLSTLLSAHSTDGEGLSDMELRDQLTTFLIAGTETTGYAVSWALYLLSQHPDIENQLHAEVDHVLDDTAITYAHLPKLDLTRRIITESLRVYPPGWIFTRNTSTDTELGTHHIPAGTAIAVSPYLLAHRADLYAEPEHFEPDRWLADRTTPVSLGAFLSFGGGPRKCIGDTFAVAEATLILGAIAARWRLATVFDALVRPLRAGVLGPRDLRLRVIDRRRAPTSTEVTR